MEPKTRGYDLGGSSGALAKKEFAFGLVEEGSACLIDAEGLWSFGTNKTCERIQEIMGRWLEMGMPPGSAFPLKIRPTSAGGDRTALFIGRLETARFPGKSHLPISTTDPCQLAH